MIRLILTSLLFASSAWAVQPQRQIEYTEKIMPFGEWMQKHPQERKVLGLFKNYVEPEVTFIQDGVKKTRVSSLMMYTARVRASINKVASSINLPALIKPEAIGELDPEIMHQPISESQIMPKVAGKGAVPNFKWCQRKDSNGKPDGKALIFLQNYEQDLSHLIGPRPWCANDGRTTCLESCFLFSSVWEQGVYAYNSLKRFSTSNPAEQKDYGLAMQAEARYYVSEAEYGQSVKELTQVNAPVRGIIELNIFYVNQAMQYGKIVAVFQEHPNSAQATVVTTMVAIGIRTRTWPKVSEILKGTSRFNTATGITAGVPVFAKNIANKLANMLEK
jgi:hypothetical protein